jgi:hypothetical protein
MQKHLRYFAAGALALGMATWSARTWAEDKPANTDQTSTDKPKEETKGITGKLGGLGAEFSTVSNIRDTLANATEAALTKGGFDDLVERLASPDRDRISKQKYNELEFKDLDGRIAQIDKDWKAKYNQSFKIKDQGAVFNETFAKIETGEVGDGNARLASAQEKNSEGTPGAAATPESKDAKKAELEKGRNIALVTIPASHDMPELTVPMIHEGPLGKWKINVPDTVDGPKLKAALLKHLTMVGDMKDQWPSDVNEAYRVVSHHVLAAVLDADNQKASDTGAKAPANP